MRLQFTSILALFAAPLFAALLFAALACRAGSSAPPAANAEEKTANAEEKTANAEEKTANAEEKAAVQQGTERAAPPEASPAAAGATTASPLSGGGARVRVFFSGHSLLDNPMPDWVETIAQSRGDSLGWEEQIVLGSPIRVRTRGDDPDASTWPGYALGKGKSGKGVDVLAELKHPKALEHGEKYERLLITERSDFLGAVKWEDTIGYLRNYHERLVEHGGPGASTLLYQCWPAIDKDEPSAWLSYVRQELFAWQCVAAKVNQTLKSRERRAGVSVVPGGVALAALVERALAGSVPGFIGSPRQRLDRIFSDDAHLTPIGTYLLSALHYGALFGKSPVGAAGPPEVPRELVPILQQLAQDALSNPAAKGAPPALSECRQRFANELCPAYYRFRDRPGEAAGCGFWASSESPLSDSAAAR